jgi:Spy/CpxP family protein refolding chaperone
MVRNYRTTAKVVAVTLALMAPLAGVLAQESIAAPGSAGLIDKDFEVALRRFISKRFYNRIDATAEQRQKLDTIWTSTMEATRPQREEVRQEALQLSSLVASDEATDEQITEKAHQLRAAHQKVMDERLNSLLKARKVLTKEQRQQINERLTQLISGGLKPKRIGLLMD